MIIAGFPNPVGWAVDKVQGFIGGVAAEGFEMLIGGLTAWVLDAVVWVVGGVFRFFLDSTDPNVQADWFVSGDGPYATTAAIGATLLVGFALAGICQGALAGDVGGMLRQMALHLPMSVLGIVGLVSVTQALVALTDALSRAVLDRFGADVHRFTDAVGSLGALTGGTATAFVIFLLALVAAIAGLILVAELVIRAALVYIVVALAPLVFATQLWPALRGASKKLLELLVALIVSKLVIAVALAVAAAAIVGTGSGGEVTALPAPEVVAEDPGGSVTQAVGVLLAAVAAFGVAAFSPLLVARLMPMTEAALVAQGVRGGPLRAGQTAMSTGYYARAGNSHRLGRVASGPVQSSGASTSAGTGAGAPAAGGAAGGGAAAGGPAGVAAAGAVAAASVATRSVRRSADAMTEAASPEPRSDASRPSGGSPKRRPPSGGGSHAG
ncbi:MAG: hypothetical protein ACRDZV_06455 [Acidimicrobiia bacterium]